MCTRSDATTLPGTTPRHLHTVAPCKPKIPNPNGCHPPRQQKIPTPEHSKPACAINRRKNPVRSRPQSEPPAPVTSPRLLARLPRRQASSLQGNPHRSSIPYSQLRSLGRHPDLGQSTS
ncbi:hypothetical protein M758_3G109400 [Ceratodon purpureus]|nr:hypothetical protein M758_3G109000 [Ceratodon purpureus]KAG0622589.1 hypothetical protein M758_3G109400 [Ceratodon purpureus]